MHRSAGDNETFDVAIVGAGPAGATAARLLATWGHSVVLLGRASSRRSLGESLPPSCTKLFDRLGIRERVDGAGFVRATGNTVRWGGSQTRTEQFDASAAGYQVPRDEFDALLVDAARTCERVVHREATVVDVTRGDASWHVVADVGGERESADARWLLDCSGRAGILARRGQRRSEAGLRTMAVVGIWEHAGAWPIEHADHTLVESYAGGWAWSVPVSGSRRFVTFMLDPGVTSLPGKAHLADAYAAELAQTSMLRGLVEGATLVDGPWGCDASPYSATSVASDQSLLIGDAASFVDPLSSFGVKKALASAWLGAVAVHTSFIDPSLSGDALALFAERERSMFTSLQQQSSQLARAAAGAHAGEFWAGRSRSAMRGALDEFGELDVEFLRGDERVLGAFAELKQRPSVAFAAGPSARVVDGVAVRGNRLARLQNVMSDGLDRGVRYCRNVDLLQLLELAPRHADVGELFDAYNRATPPVSLPDFLGALSAMMGLGLLVFAE